MTARTRATCRLLAVSQNLARGRSAALELLAALDVQVERPVGIEADELQTLHQALDEALARLVLQRGALAGEHDAVDPGDIAERSEAPTNVGLLRSTSVSYCRRNRRCPIIAARRLVRLPDGQPDGRGFAAGTGIVLLRAVGDDDDHIPL